MTVLKRETVDGVEITLHDLGRGAMHRYEVRAAGKEEAWGDDLAAAEAAFDGSVRQTRLGARLEARDVRRLRRDPEFDFGGGGL